MDDERYPHPEGIVAVIGPAGAGKSSLIKTIVASGPSITTCSSETPQIQVTRWVAADGHVINFIDTPGFGGPHDRLTETQVLQMIDNFLSKEYNRFKKQHLTGVIYVHPINIAQVDESLGQNVQMLQALCGSQIPKNLVIVTVKWDLVDLAVGVKQEIVFKGQDSGSSFKPLFEAGAVMMRHNNDIDSASKVVSYLRDNESVKAGIIDELFGLLGKSEDDMLARTKEMQDVIKAKDTVLERLLEEKRNIEELLKKNQETFDATKETMLQAEIQKLADSAQTVWVAFRTVSWGLAKTTTIATAQGRWDALCKKYTKLVWESRRVAGNARAIATDFTRDCLDVFQGQECSMEDKKEEIAGYRQELENNAKNSEQLSQGFVDLHSDAMNFQNYHQHFVDSYILGLILDKLTIFASVWAFIRADLVEIEKLLELASTSKGRLLFTKRIKTVSTIHKRLAHALHVYETNVHIRSNEG